MASFNDRELRAELAMRRLSMYAGHMEVERKNFQRAKRNWSVSLPDMLDWWGELNRSVGDT